MPDMPSLSAAQSLQPDLCWRDTPLHRLMLAALLNELNATLLSTASATRTLEDWSHRHHLAAPPTVRAIRQNTPARVCPPALRDALRLSASAPSPDALRYRHVRLMCGTLMLSEAENWYLPSRLTANMNRELDTTDTPFGRATSALTFTRRLVLAENLWSPLPLGWELSPLPAGTGQPLIFPPTLFRHHAVLSRQDGVPISAVIESYTADTLRFAPPALMDHPIKKA